MPVSIIGPGTVVNMVCVGYTADFLCWLFLNRIGLQVTMPLRILFLILGTLFASLGCACYMIADMGISPYDSVAFIITKYAHGKISFRFARVMSDVVVIVIGVVFCVMAHNSIWEPYDQQQHGIDQKLPGAEGHPQESTDAQIHTGKGIHPEAALLHDRPHGDLTLRQCSVYHHKICPQEDFLPVCQSHVGFPTVVSCLLFLPCYVILCTFL